MADFDTHGNSSESDNENIFSEPTRKIDELGRDREEVPMGYLEKRGQRNTAWRKRWFVLRGDQLLYFKSKTASSVINAIRIKDALIGEAEKRTNEHIFEVDTGSRLYILKAATEGEMRKWISDLVSRSEAHAECNHLDLLTRLTERVEYVKSAVDEKILADISDVVGTLHSVTAAKHFGKFLLDHAESWQEYQEQLTTFKEAIDQQAERLRSFKENMLSNNDLSLSPGDTPKMLAQNAPVSASSASASSSYSSSRAVLTPSASLSKSPSQQIGMSPRSSSVSYFQQQLSDADVLAAGTAALSGSLMSLAAVTMPPSPLFDATLEKNISHSGFDSLLKVSEFTGDANPEGPSPILTQGYMSSPNIRSIPVTTLPELPTDSDLLEKSSEKMTPERSDILQVVYETNEIVSALPAGMWRSGPHLKKETSCEPPPLMHSMPKTTNSQTQVHAPNNVQGVVMSVARVPAPLRSLSSFWRSLSSDPLTCALLPHGLVCLRLWLRMEEFRLLSGPMDRWHILVYILKPLIENETMCKIFGVTPSYFVEVAYNYIPKADIQRYWESRDVSRDSNSLDDNQKYELLKWYLSDYGTGEDDPLVPDEPPSSSHLVMLQRLVFLALHRLHEAFRHSPSFVKALLSMPVYDNLELPPRFLQLLPTLDQVRSKTLKDFLYRVIPGSGPAPSLDDVKKSFSDQSASQRLTGPRRSSVLLRPSDASNGQSDDEIESQDEGELSNSLYHNRKSSSNVLRTQADREFWSSLALEEKNRQCTAIDLSSLKTTHQKTREAESDVTNESTGLAGWRLSDAPKWLSLGIPGYDDSLSPSYEWSEASTNPLLLNNPESAIIGSTVAGSPVDQASEPNALTADSDDGVNKSVKEESDKAPSIPRNEAYSGSGSANLSDSEVSEDSGDNIRASGNVTPPSVQQDDENRGFVDTPPVGTERRRPDASQLIFGISSLPTHMMPRVSSVGDLPHVDDDSGYGHDEEDEGADGAFFGASKEPLNNQQDIEDGLAAELADELSKASVDTPLSEKMRSVTNNDTKTSLEQELELGEDIDVDHFF